MVNCGSSLKYFSIVRCLSVLLAAVTLTASTDARNIYLVDTTSSTLSAKVPFLGLGRKTAFFSDVEGSIELDNLDPEYIKLDVVIDATSLEASDRLTSERLKGERFFWIEKHPKITYTGQRMEMVSPTQGRIEGELTARGVSKPVTLNITFENPPARLLEGEAIHMTGTAEINRYDYNMTSYRLIVGKYVMISLKALIVPS